MQFLGEGGKTRETIFGVGPKISWNQSALYYFSFFYEKKILVKLIDAIILIRIGNFVKSTFHMDGFDEKKKELTNDVLGIESKMTHA